MLPSFIERILLIDDDQDDCMVFEMAVGQISETIQTTFVNDAEDILPALIESMPDIIFLDINMPKKSGLEFLNELRTQPHLKKIPVVMYSSSNEFRDITAAYGFGANLYFQKTASLSELVLSLRRILQMNWNQPDDIAAKYFVEGKYQPFSLT